jgi:two-component system, OmpR family, response regulator MtrA
MHRSETTKRSRILIVGSDFTRVAELRTALTADGYLVRSSGSGQEALEQSKAWRPEIVIADGLLADIEVSVFCTVLRASGAVSSILVRSGQPANIVEVLDAGADDCMDKSCSNVELKARVRSKLKKINYQAIAAIHGGDK